MYMKRNKILYMLIFPLILFLIIPNAFAEDLIDGEGTNFGSCGGNEWCFSSLGIRISLYTYNDDTGVEYHGSKDYNAYKKRPLAGSAWYTIKRAGKVAYLSGRVSNQPYNLNSWDCDKCKGDIRNIIESQTFPGYNNNYDEGNVEELKKRIIDLFGLEKEDYNIIKNSIKKVYDLENDIDLSKAYITVEPTALIYKVNDGDKRYYGTIYELAQVSKVNGHDGSNIQKNLFKFFLSQYNAIRAENPSAKVTDNKFLSRNSTDNPYILAVNGSYNENGSKQDVKYLRDSKKGYGIGVFWVGEYASEQTCSNACPSYNLSCYSTYCDSKSKNQTDKTNCMKKCGAKEPQFGCTSSSVTPKQSSSECSDPISSSKQTCKEYKNNYYTEICDESTTIKYSDDLPTTLISKKGGFNFSARLNGKKTCKLEFNYDYYLYNYYMAYGDSGKNKVQSKLSDFTNQNNFRNKKYSYEIESSDYIKFEDRQLEEIKTTKTEESKYTGYSNSNFTHSYSSTYKSVFELICYTLNNRETLLPGCNGDIKDYSTYYYAVYNDSSSKKVDTYAYARKEGSGLSDTNTCYYLNIDDKDDLENDIDCVVTINNNSSFETASVTYKVITRGKNEKITEKITEMKIGNMKAKDNGTYSLINLGYSKSNSTTVDASVTYKINGNEITKKCPVRVDLTAKDNNNNDNKCTAKNSPAEYDKIRKYCINSWNTDVDGYTSYDECYKKCSANGRNNTCKTIYEINDTEGINNYCQHYYKLDGYKSVAMCINDCSTITGYSDYIYRPIATGKINNQYNAFPNRKAGSNWIGYEELTEKDSFEGNVIYEITLTPDSINKIRKDSTNKNSYINYEGKSSSGYYQSEYVTKNKNIFTNISGRDNLGGDK